MKPIALALLIASSLSSVSCAGRPTVPSLTGTYNGAPVMTQASHGAGGSTAPVKGTYLGRRYFHPPGSKTGLAWIDVYGQPNGN